MPLQGIGYAADQPEVTTSNAEAVDFTGELNVFASHRFEIVRGPP